MTKELGFESVYVKATGSEPLYTTWKYREHGRDKHTIDYIFLKHGQTWKIHEILTVPEGDDHDERFRLPNWNYPSDHFAIGCKVEFV